MRDHGSQETLEGTGAVSPHSLTPSFFQSMRVNKMLLSLIKMTGIMTAAALPPDRKRSIRNRKQYKKGLRYL